MDGDDYNALPPSFYQHHRHLAHYHGGGASSVSSSAASRDGMFSAAPPSSAPEGGPVLLPNSVSGGRSSSPFATPAPSETIKRKRGRPRKYGVSPSPISPSASSLKKGSPTALSSSKKKEASSLYTKKSQIAALGNAGQGFTPHVIAIADGEDVAQKIMSFMQHGDRALCIISASGSISNASLHQPAVYGGYVSYQGRYDINSLCGSFLPGEDGGASRTGGLSVCLSGTDGHLVGGGVGGPLLAAGPVQVIAGSFLVDTNDVRAPKTVDNSASKLLMPIQAGSILVTSFALKSATESTGRTTTSRASGDYQSVAGSSYMQHSRTMHVQPLRSPTDWKGKQDDPSDASRSPVENDSIG
ncbi:AT-hook motif nuclear-localized protein 14-like isoform X2 [Typha angustifolia]|uniref:AT-hook motif nuclear-localized protein 14-like isoform X2 n=1 Tax=Typha angustifolia TaxID=59011 RepID=UPI003C2FC0F4